MPSPRSTRGFEIVPRRIVSIDDLSDADLLALLDRAGSYADGARPERKPAVVGSIFLKTSLRTRTGFASAAHRIGAAVVEVDERRASEASMPESIADTARTLSGYVDALVVRSSGASGELVASAREDVAWLNAGDEGPTAEHPSQALLDVFALERLVGPMAELHVALCGDLRMRAARSLLRLLSRRRPRALSLVTDPSLTDGFVLPSALQPIAVLREPGDMEAVDAVYAVGMAHGAASEAVRSKLRVDRRMLATMPDTAVVLSPMPIIDEIASSVRQDARMRYSEQSDLGLFTRMALLEWLLGRLN